MRILKATDYENASLKAANHIAAQVLLKPDSVIGLATGSTPLGAYEDLVRRHQDGELSFKEVRTVNLDEYVGLAPEDERSYAYYMHQNFLDKIDIQKDNVHLIDGLVTDLEGEAQRYDSIIHSLGCIDFQLLGIGTNGHIGFNEPSSDVPNHTHPVNLAPSTIESNKRFFDKIEDVPRKAITMGIGTILRAKKIVMMITGETKADAFDKIVFGPITPLVPASLLRLHSDFTIIADEDAMHLVEGRL